MTSRPLARIESAAGALLRLPAAGPESPPGSGRVRVFRAAPAFFGYSVARWGLRQAGAVAGLVAGIGFVASLPPQLWPLRWLEALGIAVFVAQLPLSLAVVWLDYQRRWYLVTERSLRIREGVWTLHERTMSFANVQNLEIRQGPIQGLLGIAALEVRSAGGGQPSGASGQAGKPSQDMHVAYFRGVDNAEEIRDLILARLRRLRGSGLGDLDEDSGDLGLAVEARTAPQEARSSAAAMPPQAVAAAQVLLDEARALRALLR